MFLLWKKVHSDFLIHTQVVAWQRNENGQKLNLLTFMERNEQNGQLLVSLLPAPK